MLSHPIAPWLILSIQFLPFLAIHLTTNRCMPQNVTTSATISISCILSLSPFHSLAKRLMMKLYNVIMYFKNNNNNNDSKHSQCTLLSHLLNKNVCSVRGEHTHTHIRIQMEKSSNFKVEFFPFSIMR